MPKLSSNAVLTHVLSSVEYTTKIVERMAEGVFYDGKDWYSVPVDRTSKEYLSGVKDAMNPKLWKRQAKQKIEVFEPINTQDPFDDIGILDDGEIACVLKAKATQDWLNSGKNKKFLPIHRQFVMSKYLGGDYMMDVWTTYDDMQIIGWTVSSD